MKRNLFVYVCTSCSLTVPTDPALRCCRWPPTGADQLVEEAEPSEWEELCLAASSILREA